VIDVHAHITPPELLERFPMPRSLGDIQGMIEEKARLGIELSIVGSPVGVGTMVPMPGMDPFSQPYDALKRFHDWLAETVAEHSERLRAYAWTNPFDDALVDQTAQTVRDGGFVGLIVNTSIRGEYLDSSKADAFFAMAAELDVPILLHPPPEPVGAGSLSDARLVEQLARFWDVTASLAVLAFGKRLRQYPDLKLIGAMAGGAIALLPPRLEGARRAPAMGGPALADGEIADPPAAAIGRFYVDTATASPENLQANLAVLGAGQLLFGTDSPPAARPLDEAIASVERAAPSEEDRRRIFTENARALFRLN